VAHAESAGRTVRAVGRDDYESARGTRCKLLVNANGNSRKYLANREPTQEFQASVASVQASLHDFEFETYLYLSSCDVYADPSGPATTQEDRPGEPASRYGFHKRLAERLVAFEAPDHLVLRLGGMVGPGLWKNPVHDALQGGPLWLDPASELQFLPTAEVARLAFALLEQGVRKQSVNLGGAGTLRLAELLEALGTEVPVQPESPRVRYESSLERLRTLGHAPPPSRESVLAYCREQGALT